MCEINKLHREKEAIDKLLTNKDVHLIKVNREYFEKKRQELIREIEFMEVKEGVWRRWEYENYGREV